MRLCVQIALTTLAFGLTASSVGAHEFWIDGTVVADGTETSLELDLKVGQKLDGVSLPYIPETVERFEWVQGGIGAITGRVGDIPAARVPLGPETAIIFHRTEPRRLVHRDWEKFLEYLDMEGLTGIAEAHDRRGLTRTGFVETYTRHAKLALVPSDGMAMQDRYLGSPLEIVLDRVVPNDGELVITGHVVSKMPPRVHQIAVIQPLAATTTLSDEDGRFTLNIPADAPVLLNTVQVSADPSGDAAWHSDWASLLLKLR